MPLWTYPAVITSPPTGRDLTATLDLGCRLTQAARIRVAGINPKPGSVTEQRLHDLLPEGARILALGGRLDTGTPLRAHLLLPDGTDVVSKIRHRRDPLPTAEYGGTLHHQWTYPALVEQVCDGDTFHACIDLGNGSHLNTTVRAAHINAPEHGTPQGDAATIWAQQHLTPGAEITLRSRRLDKYGRLLADITTSTGNYSNAMIAAGHAVPYEGGTR